MRIYTKQNVYDQSLERIRWVFKEFNNKVIVTTSGGKDSTTVMELTLEVIRELKAKGELPEDYKLKLFFLDQEAEWTRTIEYMVRVAQRDDVELYWSQVDFDLGNSATVGDENQLRCFDPQPDVVYCQPLQPYAYDRLYVDDNNNPIPIKELNTHRRLKNGRWEYDKQFNYIEHNKTDFFLIFDDMYSWIGNGESYAILQGIKTSESPARSIQLTYQHGYKGITWSSRAGLNKEHVRFQPIYDWSRVDNFTYFHRSQCDYNKLYDDFLAFGIQPASMRVSSLTHETAVAHAVSIVQEIDRELYNRLCDRLPGISTYSQLQEEAQKIVLPPNFKDFEEFARYLIKNLTDPKNKHYFLEMYDTGFYQKRKHDVVKKTILDKAIIQCVLTNDIDKTKWKTATFVMDKQEKRKERYGEYE